MRRLHPGILLSSLLACLLYSEAIAAQPANPRENLTLSQAERRSIELKQGMTLQDVEQLLGKPRRTALRTTGYGTSAEPSQGTLQWTYAWPSPTQYDRTLQVVFGGKSPEGWLVHSWDWTSY